MPSENISQPAGKKIQPSKFLTHNSCLQLQTHTLWVNLTGSSWWLLANWIGSVFQLQNAQRHAPNKYMISTASEQNGQLLKHFHKKRLGDLCLFDLSFRYCCWFWRCSTVAAIKHLALSKLPDSQENFGCVDLNCFGSQQSIWFTRAKND